MARLLCTAGLSLLALCRGAPIEWQRSAQTGSNTIDPADHVALLQQRDADAEDHVALLQHRAGPHRRQSKTSAPAKSRPHLKNDIQTGQDPAGTELYCAAYPELCKHPFDCHLADATLLGIKFDTFGVASDGKPDLQSWCSQPQYASYMSKCAAGKLIEAAHIQFQLTEAGMYGGITREYDGSYCFIEGHCVNMAVTENTTMEEASQMCDERFGREAWTRSGSSSAPAEDTIGYGIDDFEDPRNGFTSPEQTRPYLLAACAMGNFHCDVIYCRETFCKSDYYVNKYGHLLKKFGWVP